MPTYTQFVLNDTPAFTVDIKEDCRMIAIEWSDSIKSDVLVIDKNKNTLSEFDNSIKEILSMVDSAIRESF